MQSLQKFWLILQFFAQSTNDTSEKRKKTYPLFQCINSLKTWYLPPITTWPISRFRGGLRHGMAPPLTGEKSLFLYLRRRRVWSLARGFPKRGSSGLIRPSGERGRERESERGEGERERDRGRSVLWRRGLGRQTTPLPRSGALARSPCRFLFLLLLLLLTYSQSNPTRRRQRCRSVLRPPRDYNAGVAAAVCVGILTWDSPSPRRQAGRPSGDAEEG